MGNNKMKISELNEDYKTSAAKQLQSTQELQQACDLINAGGQLSWTLTPAKLNQKLGSEGAIFGLFDGDEIVGTIGLKHSTIQAHSVAEVGYLYVIPEHRNFQNLMKLYNIASEYAPSYDFVYATTIKTNQTINTILQRNSKVKFAFSARSPFSSNILNYWISKNARLDSDEAIEILKSEFGGSRLTESASSEKIALVNFPNSEYSERLVARSGNKVEMNNNPSAGQTKVVLGRGAGLPTEINTVYVGNRYHGKDEQYRLLRGVVPLVPTFHGPDDIEGEFIAKKIHGQQQKGQLINQIPDNPGEYIFQPKIDIIKEYRVVTFYMNGEFHVSGVYQKMGSNMSVTSITNGQVYDSCVAIAKKACEKLKYGASGVDIAQTSYNVQENVGGIVSKFGKVMGNLQQKTPQGKFVFFEANTLPSMANPMILHDVIKKIFEVRK